MKVRRGNIKHLFTLAVYFLSILNTALAAHRQEEPENDLAFICKNSANFFSHAHNKPHPNGYFYDINPAGILLYQAPVPYENQNSYLGYNPPLPLYREKIKEKTHAQNRRIAERIAPAIASSKKSGTFTQEVNDALRNNFADLHFKNSVATTKEEYQKIKDQKGAMDVNCGEYSKIAAGAYLKAWLNNSTKIMSVTLYGFFTPTHNSHSYVIVNGPDRESEIIKNNATAVAEVIKGIDNTPEAHLCDEYNHENGLFNNTQNKLYRSLSWVSVYIQNLRLTIPETKNILPDELNATVSTINSELNNRMKM